MSPIRAITFDLHDTLVAVPGDDPTARRRSGFAVLTELTGFEDFDAFCAADDAARARLYAPGNPDLFDFGVNRRYGMAVRELLGHDLEVGALARMVAAYVDAWIDTLLPLPGTTEALDRLGQLYRLAIVSDFGDAPGLYRILERFGLAGRFDPVVISVDVGRAKPHPAMFSAALERLRVEPSAVVHVGDSLVCDVEGARRSGIRPILMDHAGTNPHFAGERISRLTELEWLLDGGAAPNGQRTRATD